ncbi:hypothetical protein WJX74_010175 [Apatococcus lobatus]|uniref:Uncharacterized protein n=1 Tax=Apatococcus lobatus TaxID=904363 RepID=A0AAW1R3L1_9CHLO
MLAACVSLTGRLPVRTVSNPARFLLASVPGSRPLQKNQSCLSRPASTQQRCRPLRALPLIQASSEEIAMMFFGTSIVPYSVFFVFLDQIQASAWPSAFWLLLPVGVCLCDNSCRHHSKKGLWHHPGQCGLASWDS